MDIERLLLIINLVFFIKPPQPADTNSGFSSGSLSRSWSFTFTLFMERFGEELLYVVDYERNVLILRVEKETKSHLYLAYNNVAGKVILSSICGCDPCDNILVNFHLYTSQEKIIIKCNNNHQFEIRKINNYNRQLNRIPDAVIFQINIRFRMYISVNPTTRGCLHSFYHDSTRVSFNDIAPMFLSSCPRECLYGICNQGQCRMLDVSGPQCDCSSTAFNGPYCNNDLQVYRREQHNSYEIVEGANSFELKLTWRRSSNMKLCLLQFVHEAGHETLFIYQSYIMRGSSVFGNIIRDNVNFMTISSKNTTMEIKINNIIVERRRVYLQKSIINIGFSQFGGECETFKGAYDLKFTGLCLTTFTSDINTKSKTPYSILTDWKFICGFLTSIIFVGIILVIVITRVRIYMRRKSIRNTIKDENEYDMGSRRADGSRKMNSDDYGYSQVYSNSPNYTTQNSRFEEVPPDLPGRNV